MKRLRLIPAVVLALLATACTENTDPGNDREAALSPPEPPAEVASVGEAILGVDSGLLFPGTMTDADLRRVPGGADQCLFRFTRVGLPAFAYGQAGVLKLNGKLVPLPAGGDGRYAAGRVTVTVRPVGDDAAAGEPFVAELVLQLPGTEHERGYHGFSECSGQPPNERSTQTMR